MDVDKGQIGIKTLPEKNRIKVESDEREETLTPAQARTYAEKLQNKHRDALASDDADGIASIIADLEISADRLTDGDSDQ